MHGVNQVFGNCLNQVGEFFVCSNVETLNIFLQEPITEFMLKNCFDGFVSNIKGTIVPNFNIMKGDDRFLMFDQIKGMANLSAVA